MENKRIKEVRKEEQISLNRYERYYGTGRECAQQL